MKNILKALLGIAATFGAGLVGYLFVGGDVGAWYASLVKPAGTPPDWVFGVVWTILYVLMSASLILIWTRTKPSTLREGWVRFYFVQLLFNAAWTMFFFGLHATLISFFDLLFLGFIVISLMAGAWELEKRAAYILVPYVLWIFYAGYLNLGVWLLN